MKRVHLTDEEGRATGRWFDLEKAEPFKEDSYHNGSNWISKSTGSQFNHEKLYRTKSGVWVLNAWSDWQGSRETFEIVSNLEAAEFFARNEYEEVPTLIEKELAELEV